MFAEVLVPITKKLEVTLAARHDDYSGFGGTTNPVSLRFTPIDTLLTRASYNTGFRVPNFNQLFFGITESPYSGKGPGRPGQCPTGKVDTTKPGCESITPTTLSGRQAQPGPRGSKQGRPVSSGRPRPPSAWALIGGASAATAPSRPSR